MDAPEACEVLGVGPDATAEELRKAYKARAFELHPDRHEGDAEYVEKFKALQGAYEELLEVAARSQRPSWSKDYGYEDEPAEVISYGHGGARRRRRVTEEPNWDPLDPDAGDRIWSAYVGRFDCAEIYLDEITGEDVRGRSGSW